MPLQPPLITHPFWHVTGITGEGEGCKSEVLMEFRCQKYHRFISGYVLINPPTIRMYSSTNISARLSQIFILSLSLPYFQRNNVIPFASYSFLTGFQREIDFIRDIIKNDAHSRFSLRDRLKAIERPFTIFCLFASFRRYIEFCTTEKMEESSWNGARIFIVAWLFKFEQRIGKVVVISARETGSTFL